MSDPKSTPKGEVRYRGDKGTDTSSKNTSSDDNSKTKKDPPELLRSMPIVTKYNNFVVRTIWTLVMMAVFLTLIAAGHFYLLMLVVLVAIGAFKEILNLKRNREKEEQIPQSVILNWYFFFVGVYYFFLVQFATKMPHLTSKYKIAQDMVQYHNLITFALWLAGFLSFVLTLKKGFYRYQFKRFGWTHLCCFMLVAPVSAVLSNLYSGYIWFCVPILLIIANDTFAYIFGFFFGKTRLIELSPKKTWEGFIGGMLSTIFFAILFSTYLVDFKWMICPQDQITLKPFQLGNMDCEVPSIFKQQNFNAFGYELPLTPFQFHSIIFSLFASLVAPFGGFFASGFKRALKVKDFAEIIPGHGGITDRMDCQFMMGFFVFLYIQQFVFGRLNYIQGIAQYVLTELNQDDQLLLFNELQNQLKSSGLLNATLGIDIY